MLCLSRLCSLRNSSGIRKLAQLAAHIIAHTLNARAFSLTTSKNTCEMKLSRTVSLTRKALELIDENLVHGLKKHVLLVICSLKALSYNQKSISVQVRKMRMVGLAERITYRPSHIFLEVLPCNVSASTSNFSANRSRGKRK